MYDFLNLHNNLDHIQSIQNRQHLFLQINSNYLGYLQ